MGYEDRYTDDTNGMAEPVTLLKPEPEPRLQIERLVEPTVNVEHEHPSYPDVAAAIDREDQPTTDEERARIVAAEEAQMLVDLKLFLDGELEMIRFASSAAHVLTRLCVRAAAVPALRDELAKAAAYQPVGFFALCNILDQKPSEFFESLAFFRYARERREREAGSVVA